MKVKSEFTIIERAIQTIDGFSAVDERIRQQTILRGQSRSTFENYIRQIARICLHFGKLPEAITEEEINEYLTGLARDPKSLTEPAAHYPEPFRTQGTFQGAGIIKAPHPAHAHLFCRPPFSGELQSGTMPIIPANLLLFSNRFILSISLRKVS